MCTVLLPTSVNPTAVNKYISIVTKHFTENEDYLRAYSNQPLVPIQSQINPAHALLVHFLTPVVKLYSHVRRTLFKWILLS
jgi:hypothetical protein